MEELYRKTMRRDPDGENFL